MLDKIKKWLKIKKNRNLAFMISIAILVIYYLYPPTGRAGWGIYGIVLGSAMLIVGTIFSITGVGIVFGLPLITGAVALIFGGAMFETILGSLSSFGPIVLLVIAAAIIVLVLIFRK
jgi:hypothetical protein